MVGRLVEQQQVGIAEQRAGQRHAHAPAAGEFAAGPCLRLVVEAQAVQDRGGARRRGGGADLVEPVMDLGEAVRVVAVSASASRAVRSTSAASTASRTVMSPPGASCGTGRRGCGRSG